MAKNLVISGDYKGASVSLAWFGGVKIGGIKLDKLNVDNYEIIDEKSRKSATSAVGRAVVGSFYGITCWSFCKKQRDTYHCYIF